MAGPLTAVERFFERLFERPAARLFQVRVEPVQIQRALERAIESERRVHARRAYVPSHYRVLLSQADAAALSGDQPALAREFAEQVRVYARAHGYVLLARPTVEVQPSAAVVQGDVRVFAEPVARGAAASPPRESGASTPPGLASEPAAAGDEDALSQATAVFAAPQPSTPRAQLAVRTPGQPVSRLAVRPGTIRIGRSVDNDIVLPDAKVSRHHGQVGIRRGMLVYADLGSTNGSYLNGSAVSEIALGPGDVLQIGSSTVTVEPAP
jgi:hypothetical protein